MRTHFDEQLEHLHVELIQMGALCRGGHLRRRQSVFRRRRDAS